MVSSPLPVQLVVQQSSDQPIVGAIRDICHQHWSRDEWLDNRNRYWRHTVSRIDTDLGSGGRLRIAHLQQYIAASVISHCLDGWTYLSHAVDGLLDGDAATAIHLAYYAELRAAMSFLASEGIGIFNYTHCWFDNAGHCHRMAGGGTHKVVWDALNHWGTAPAKSARLLSLFRVAGQDFGQWVQAAGYSPASGTSAALAHDWLATWSLDLAMPREDRDLRNEMSYRPRRLNLSGSPSGIAVLLRVLSSFWRASEPSGQAMFEGLDLYLLRHALQSVYTAQNPHRARGRAYESYIRNVLTNLGLSSAGSLASFLMRPHSAANHPLMVEAKKRGQTTHALVRPVSIISRAFLLLRLASAATHNLLRQNAVTSADLEFWWHEIGAQLGLWDTGGEPSQTTDLWADVELVLGEIDAWCGANTTGSIYKARTELGTYLWQFTQFERAGLWAMGL